MEIKIISLLLSKFIQVMQKTLRYQKDDQKAKLDEHITCTPVIKIKTIRFCAINFENYVLVFCSN
jgi:hypothetical protein